MNTEQPTHLLTDQTRRDVAGDRRLASVNGEAMRSFTWTITADYPDGQPDGKLRYVLDDGMQTRTYSTVEAACAEVIECANLYADLDLCLAELRNTERLSDDG